MTARRVVLCLPPGEPFADPDPAETGRRDLELVPALAREPASVVGWRAGGREALELALAHPELVERVVLVWTPRPDDLDVRSIAAKTLLLYPQSDLADGKWFRTALPNMRLEVSPREPEAFLQRAWARALSFAAPHSLHKG